MSYRVELAKTGRAGCQATHCKKEGTKINLKTLRQGTLVTINEHSTMRWRHWGCVTPTVVMNWKNTHEMDMDLCDGYDELPKDLQAKVKRTFEQEHVDDEDWNGDLACNRYDPNDRNKGMFVKTPKKKAAKDDGDGDGSPTKKKAPKKRGRAMQDDDDEEDAEPVPKKARGKSKKAAADEDEAEAEPPAKKAKQAKKTKIVDEPKADDEPEVEEAPKKGRGKKAKSADAIPPSDETLLGDDYAAPPKSKTKTKKGTAKSAMAADDEDTPKPKPQKRRGKKAAAEEG